MVAKIGISFLSFARLALDLELPLIKREKYINKLPQVDKQHNRQDE